MDGDGIYYNTCALLKLAGEWIKGELFEINPPSQKEGKVILDYLQTCQLKQAKPSIEANSSAIDEAYQKIRHNNVINHYAITSSHRKWIRLIYRLMSLASALQYESDLDYATEIHDLSKYGAEEAIGYGIMFGKTGAFRELDECSGEKQSWEGALKSHLSSNSHHPQFFAAGEDMGAVDLEESVIDMLACRAERQLASDPLLLPSRLFDLEHKFLTR